MKLSREAIFAANDIKTETVTVEEWGGDVTVTALSAAVYYEMIDTHPKAKMGTLLVCYCTVDENGDRLFSDADIDKLSGRSSAALTKVYLAARRINGLDNTQAEAEKNSETDQDDTPDSDSQS